MLNINKENCVAAAGTEAVFLEKRIMSKDRNNFFAPLHLVCADDEYRPAFAFVYFIDGFAYATNGSMFIQQSIDDYCTVINKESLNGHALHKDSFANIMKFESVEARENGVECWDEGGKKAFFSYKAVDNAPNFKRVLDDIPSPTPVQAFGINPKYFDIAGKVLVHGLSPIRVRLTGTATAMLLDCETSPNQRCFIMPSSINDTLF